MTENDRAGSRQYYHGTRADLKEGDLIAAGHSSNFGARRRGSWVYLTGTLDAAIWGAELAQGEGRKRTQWSSRPVRSGMTPNLTDKKFPGNPTKSYRSRKPLRVIGEITEWAGHSPARLLEMKDHLERLKAQGIEAID